MKQFEKFCWNFIHLDGTKQVKITPAIIISTSCSLTMSWYCGYYGVERRNKTEKGVLITLVILSGSNQKHYVYENP